MSLVERLESELPDLPYAEDPAERERAKVERMVTDGVALIAEEDGNAVGYALARYGDHGPTTVYVSDLWVDSTVRGRGIGRELLRARRRCGGRAREHPCPAGRRLQNREAIAFYDHLGFEEGAKIFRAKAGALAQERSRRPRRSARCTCRRTTRRASSESCTTSCRGSRRCRPSTSDEGARGPSCGWSRSAKKRCESSASSSRIASVSRC